MNRADDMVEHLYEELQRYISETTQMSPQSTSEAARLKIELYKAAFPQGALSKGSTIREPYAYGGKLSPHRDDHFLLADVDHRNAVL